MAKSFLQNPYLFTTRCMNPYEVLELPPDATASQIKDAYRKAVKKFHPDVSKGADDDSIKIINEAYAILSDPDRRARYDSGFGFVIEDVPQEDPKELYKREYLRRRRMETEAKRAREESIYKILYKVNVAIFIIAFALVIDQWLPTLTRSEVAVREWVNNIHIRGGSYRVRYMQTENRTFAVPSEIGYFAYDYSNPKPIAIKITPLFRIPREVKVMKGEEQFVFEPARTIYSFVIPFHYILFLMSCAAVAMRRHSSFAFSYGFTPALILLLCLAIFLILA